MGRVNENDGGNPPSYPQQGYPQQEQYYPQPQEQFYPQPQNGYRPQPQEQFYPQPQQVYYPQQGRYDVHVVQAPQVILRGNCPQCNVGYLHDDYGCFAIFLAIFFFPLGVLCCLAMREKRCSNCFARF